MDRSVAAKVGELLPALDNVVEEVVELAHQALGAGAEHVQPRLEILNLVLDAAVLALAARRSGKLHLLPRGLQGVARAPELAHPDPPRAGGVLGLLRHPLLQHCDGRHEAAAAGVRATARALHRAGARGGAGDGAPGEDEQEQRARVVQRVEEPPEAVEAGEPRVRGAQQQPLVELQRQRGDPRIRERAVLLLRGHGLPSRRRDRPHHLASGESGGVLEPIVQSGDGAGGYRAVPLDGGEAELDGEACVPEARGLVHVLIEPPAAGRQVELAHHERELRVQAPEKRRCPEQRRQRRQPAGAAEVVQPARQGAEEGVHGVVGRRRRRTVGSGKPRPARRAIYS
uniref:Uncharacterized protein n=1 Tax=Arundo donax TaxID=35708 RepID=A0A0A9D770_ARUDO